MKKILQISNYQYPHIGGIEQVARDIADSLLDDKEIEQKMICFNEDAQDGDYWHDMKCKATDYNVRKYMIKLKKAMKG